MNTAVALLAMVCLAGFAQAAPNMASLRQKLAAMKRGGPGGDDPKWPSGWMEFAQLIGRCDSAFQVFKFFDTYPTEGMLITACPHIFKVVEDMEDATEADIDAAEPEVKKHFPLMQCANLQAEREAVAYIREANNEPENPFEEGAAVLFAKCQKMFDKVAADMAKDADEIDQQMSGSKRSSLTKALRQLINFAKKN